MYCLYCDRVSAGELDEILKNKPSMEKYEPHVQIRTFGKSSFNKIVTNSDGVSIQWYYHSSEQYTQIQWMSGLDILFTFRFFTERKIHLHINQVLFCSNILIWQQILQLMTEVHIHEEFCCIG
jgi:hypothetical protein